MLIFNATYFDKHPDGKSVLGLGIFKDGVFEFKSCTWKDAVDTACSMCYKNAHDGLKSLELVGKTVDTEMRFCQKQFPAN